jgi:hypothetical protein
MCQSSGWPNDWAIFLSIADDFPEAPVATRKVIAQPLANGIHPRLPKL